MKSLRISDLVITSVTVLFGAGFVFLTLNSLDVWYGLFSHKLDFAKGFAEWKCYDISDWSKYDEFYLRSQIDNTIINGIYLIGFVISLIGYYSNKSK